MEIVQINLVRTQSLKTLFAGAADIGRRAIHPYKGARSRIPFGPKLGGQHDLLPTPGKSLTQ